MTAYRSHGKISRDSTGGNLSLLTTEGVVLKPWAQKVIPVRSGGGEFSGGEGLITPMRSKQVINCKFSTAYGYVDDGVKEIIIANTAGEDKIKKEQNGSRIPPEW